KALKSELREIKAREELTVQCQICLAPNFRPRILECGHCLCEQCVQEIYKAQRHKILTSCPDCRQRIRTTPRLCYVVRHHVEAWATSNGVPIPSDVPPFVWPPITQ
ncbi:hypothetical protein HDZ31DRAFT_25270, partial [Schizophyllum fasciatum]